MFRQVAVVESFCLLEYAALITDEGVFLVQIDGGEVGTLHHSAGGVQFAHDEFQQGCFSTAVFSFQAEAVAASQLEGEGGRPELLYCLRTGCLHRRSREAGIMKVDVLCLDQNFPHMQMRGIEVCFQFVCLWQ